MISINKISVYFGGQTLFDEVSFMVNKGDRIGLVGKNGAGKTTLLNLINGEITPSEGNISISKNLQIGYLKQEIDFNNGNTVLQEAETAFKKVREIEKELSRLKEQLNERSDSDSDEYLQLIMHIGEREEQFIQLDGYNLISEISKVLLGLGFEQTDFKKLTDTFSGGWRMRVELAKILLQKPDTILLDEPTNHLDIESIIWLEQWLKNFTGAVILVSHDRTFLDAVTNRTIEIADGNVFDYKAPYTKYVQLRKERQATQEQAKKNQDKFIRHTEQLIDKFRYKKSKASFAQALIKKLDKLERFEVDKNDTATMKFRFPPAPHSGKVTLEADHIYKNYGALEVLRDVSLTVNKGDKIAFVGKNGEGKTTLAKIFADHLNFEGNLKLGHLVKVGYYAQNQSDLLYENFTVLQTIENAANEQTSAKVRNILGSFLFSGDIVDKKIKVLSGGERARVALCKLLLEPFNLLVMDEPTNHLDMGSKDILKQALVKYDGTLIIVSHDRDFLQGLTKKVYEFKNKKIKEYIGDVTDFLETRKMNDLKQLEITNQFAQKNSVKSIKPGKLAFKKNNQLQRDIRKAKNRAGKLESEIDEAEKILKELDSNLADPVRFNELVKENSFFDDYWKKQNHLSRLISDWENIQEFLEKLEKERDKS